MLVQRAVGSSAQLIPNFFGRVIVSSFTPKETFPERLGPPSAQVTTSGVRIPLYHVQC